MKIGQTSRLLKQLVDMWCSQDFIAHAGHVAHALIVGQHEHNVGARSLESIRGDQRCARQHDDCSNDAAREQIENIHGVGASFFFLLRFRCFALVDWPPSFFNSDCFSDRGTFRSKSVPKRW